MPVFLFREFALVFLFLTVHGCSPLSLHRPLPLSLPSLPLRQVIERILFVYAKLNPGINYVQGMNEILGPIYYCLASDPSEEWSVHSEADTFFCFTLLMSEIRDVFIKTLDDSDIGIGAFGSFERCSAWASLLTTQNNFCTSFASQVR